MLSLIFISGWPRPANMRASHWALVALIILSAWSRPLPAAESEAAGEQPSLELLEFLGEWQTKEGVWFDPIEKDEKTTPAQEQSHEKK